VSGAVHGLPCREDMGRRGVIERLSADVESATPKAKSTATSNAPAAPWART
jgi:hypothetical protein